MYENWKILKSELEEKQDEYSKVADWCNENGGYMIVEDGKYYKVAPIPEPTPPTDEEIRQMRERAYTQEVDPLHSRKQRKTILEEWTENDEREYILKVKELSDKIAKEYPYEAKNNEI